jgi:hypothetical protein
LLTLRFLLFDAAGVASAVDDDDEAVGADDDGINTLPSSLAANDADNDDSIMTYSPSLL